MTYYELSPTLILPRHSCTAKALSFAFVFCLFHNEEKKKKTEKPKKEEEKKATRAVQYLNKKKKEKGIAEKMMATSMCEYYSTIKTKSVILDGKVNSPSV